MVINRRSPGMEISVFRDDRLKRTLRFTGPILPTGSSREHYENYVIHPGLLAVDGEHRRSEIRFRSVEKGDAPAEHSAHPYW